MQERYGIMDAMATPSPSPQHDSSWISGMKQAMVALLLGHPDHPEADQHKDFIRRHLKILSQEPQETLRSLASSDRSGLFPMLAKIDPEIAMAWWHLKGEGVWGHVDQYPFDLVDWLFEMKSFRPRDDELAEAIQDAADQGMRVAMPLRKKEARYANDSPSDFNELVDESSAITHPGAHLESLGERWEDRILSQEGLTRLTLNADPPWADRGWLFQKLQEHGGAPLFTYTMVGPESTQCPSLSPHTMIGRCERLSQPWSIRWGSWLDFWFEKRLEKEEAPSYILPWLEEKGVETIPIQDRILAGRAQFAASFPPSEGKEKRWLKVLAVLGKDSNGAGRDSNSGLPFSFLALQSDRSLLAQALKHPPPGGLDAKGSLGETIWDSLLFPTAQSANLFKPGVGAIEQLLEEIPLQCRSTQGFLWHAKREPWANALAHSTLHSHPHVWLGDTEAARRGAREVLTTLVTALLLEYQANALDALKRLFELEESDPTLLHPEIKDVMRAAHELLSSHPNVEKAGKVMITTKHPAPEPQGTTWYEPIGELLDAASVSLPLSTLPGIALLENHLKSMIQELQMQAWTPKAPESGESLVSPKPRSVRL